MMFSSPVHPTLNNNNVNVQVSDIPQSRCRPYGFASHRYRPIPWEMNKNMELKHLNMVIQCEGETELEL